MNLIQWFALLLLFFSPLMGIYLGNPLLPQLPSDGVVSSKEEFAQFRLGYIGDFIHSSNDDLSANLQLATFGCALHRKLLFELMGGSSSVQSTMKQSGTLETFYASGAFCYGGRIQGILKQWGKFVLGASASGILGRSKLQEETVQGRAIDFPSNKVRLKAWQAGVAVARKNEMFVPYLGFNVGNFLVELKSMNRKTNHHIAGILGGSIVGFAAMVASVEARFFAEQSVTMACYVAF